MLPELALIALLQKPPAMPVMAGATLAQVEVVEKKCNCQTIRRAAMGRVGSGRRYRVR